MLEGFEREDVLHIRPVATGRSNAGEIGEDGTTNPLATKYRLQRDEGNCVMDERL